MEDLNVRGVAHGNVLPGDALDTLRTLGIEWRRDSPGVIELVADGRSYRLKSVSNTAAGALVEGRDGDIAPSETPALVALDHVSPRMAPLLRERGLHYVDLAGNASIRLPGLAIEVSGRPRVAVPRRQRSSPFIRRAGVRVLFVLLSEPDRASTWRVRQVAHVAGVSVGAAQGVLADLRERGFLHDDGLERTRELLDGWLMGYSFDRKLREARYSFEHRRQWWDPATNREALQECEALLSGEDAAEYVGLSLRGTSGIVYLSGSPARLVASARLRSVSGGALEVRDRWWNPLTPALLAPTPLLYADLMASDDPRQAEAAAELRRTDALLRRLDED